MRIYSDLKPKKMVKILFFLVWFLFHPVHVSITSIDYIPEADSFKVFIRMYYDDFLLDCKLAGKEIQDSEIIDGQVSSLDKVEEYIGEKVIILVNEEQLKGKIKDLNLADNEISMNLNYSSGTIPKTITVKNLLLTELYNDQVNMLIVRINDFEEGVKLTSDLTEQTFNLK